MQNLYTSPIFGKKVQEELVAPAHLHHTDSPTKVFVA